MFPFDAGELQAVILDVDGTLYRQGVVRLGMCWRLLRAVVRHPREGVMTVAALRAYRMAQEDLRLTGCCEGDLVEEQLCRAGERTGLGATVVREWVTRWMEQEPLALIARAVREGLVDFLEAARSRGVRLGVFSDYPAAGKLEAMGVARYFEIVVCAQDPDVRRFKPNPLGLEVALQRLGAEKSRALYIGDRPEVDATTAAAAGIPCVILGRRRLAHPEGWVEVPSYRDLAGALRGRADGGTPEMAAGVASR